MANKLLSIQLGTGMAKLAVIMPNGRKVTVFSAYNLELPEGMCDDGVILNPEGLAQELRVFMSRYAITCKKLVFVIASKRIATKEAVIPFVKEKQIQSIIQVNAPEYFPVSNIEEYSLNYSILEIMQNETKQYRLSVTATPNELLKGYNDLAQAMRMPIEVMDHAGNAILQILKNQMLPNEVAAILQLGREGTVINIMNGGVLVMQRNVGYGLDAVLTAVRESFKLNEEEAYDFIIDNDINRVCQSYPDVNDVLMTMMNSISRIFEFYNSRAGENQITSIKFVGDGAMINGIGTVIEQNLQIPTEEMVRLLHVDIKRKYGMADEDAANFMANIGAVIKPVRLKYVGAGAEGEKSEEKLPIWMIVAAAIAAAAMVGSSFGIYYFNKVKAETLQKQADALASMRTLEARLAEARELSNVVDGFYQSTRGANDSIHRLITDLEQILPQGMSIDAISIDNGRVAISAGGIGKKSVAKIIMELKALKYVSDVYVDYVSEVDDLLGKYDSFTLSFNISDIHAIEEAEQDSEEAEAEAAEEAGYEEDVFYYEDSSAGEPGEMDYDAEMSQEVDVEYSDEADDDESAESGDGSSEDSGDGSEGSDGGASDGSGDSSGEGDSSDGGGSSGDNGSSDGGSGGEGDVGDAAVDSEEGGE